MNFNITEEQQLLMESIQQFMERYAPESEVKKWYENHHVPTEVSKAFVEAGFGFLGVPEEYGGTPCDMVTLMMFAKEISRLTAGTMPFMSNILNMYDILLLGTPEQIKMALDSYVETGESCFSLAISEPQAGSDNSSMTTTAKRVGDKIILNGTKTFVTHGDVSPMTIIVAKEEDPSRENKRMSMYMVPLNTKGISTSRLHKIGQGTTAFCEMYIDNVECDDSCLVGECGKGFLQLMQNFEIERLLICAQALGLAEAAMEDAAKYAAQRVQFNQPIYKFQQIQQMLTDMEIKIVNMQNLLYKCAWEHDNNISIRLDSALAKRYICKSATEVCSDAMQIFGGIGYTTETRASRCWQDSRGWQFAGGTNEVMVHIAGRQIIKKYNK